ncbi:MAG: type II toxin-antitoxin system Phd/YefM family antitoxin [Spirochaetaceae bacterium]
MKEVTTHQAKTHLSQLIRDVQAGETIIIRQGRNPVARLSALSPRGPGRPNVGTVTSDPVTYSDDAFAPLSDKELGEWGL